MIFDIIDGLELGELVAHDPPPRYCDVLFYVMDKHHHLARNMHHIKIVTTPSGLTWNNVKNNIYNISSGIGEVIDKVHDLNSITLQGFDRDLVAGVAWSKKKCNHCDVNLEHNSMLTRDVMFALRSKLQLHVTLHLKKKIICIILISNSFFFSISTNHSSPHVTYKKKMGRVNKHAWFFFCFE